MMGEYPFLHIGSPSVMALYSPLAVGSTAFHLFSAQFRKICSQGCHHFSYSNRLFIAVRVDKHIINADSSTIVSDTGDNRKEDNQCQVARAISDGDQKNIYIFVHFSLLK